MTENVNSTLSSLMCINFTYEFRYHICLLSYVPTSVKRIAGQSFKFGWTHTNSAGHNTCIRTNSIKKAGLFTLLGVLAGHCC